MLFSIQTLQFLRLARKLIDHKDYEPHLPNLLEMLKKIGYLIKFIGYRDVFAFRVSGGLIGVELVLHFEWLENIIMLFDYFLVKIISLTRLRRFICWRYIIVASKP